MASTYIYTVYAPFRVVLVLLIQTNPKMSTGLYWKKLS